MLNNFPTYIDDFNLKQTREEKNAVEVIQRLQPLDILYAIQALETKVGCDDSTETSSLDYKVSALTALIEELISNQRHIETGVISLTADVETVIRFRSSFDTGGYGFFFNCTAPDGGTVAVWYATKQVDKILIKPQGDCVCEYIAIY